MDKIKRFANGLLGVGVGVATGAVIGLPTLQMPQGIVFGVIVSLAATIKWNRPLNLALGSSIGTVVGWLAGKSFRAIPSAIAIFIDFIDLFDVPSELPPIINILIIPLALFFISGPIIGLVIGIIAAIAVPKFFRGDAKRGIAFSLASGLLFAFLFFAFPQGYADKCYEGWETPYLKNLTFNGNVVQLEYLLEDQIEEYAKVELSVGERFRYSAYGGLGSDSYEVLFLNQERARILFITGAELGYSRCFLEIFAQPENQ